MISWIQKTFQQHFRIIFTVLLAIIIVSFVFTIGAAPGIGQADRGAVERKAFGYNLASQEDQSRLFGDAALSAQLQAGYAPDGAELQSYAFQRAAALSIANELKIPSPSKEEVTEFIKTLRVFSGQDGQFDAPRYTAFRDSLKTNPSLNEATVGRVLSDDIRSANVQTLLAGPGYVLPLDVKTQLEQADASWTLGVATADYASFKPSIPVNDALLSTFFSENTFRYEIPARIEVSYAEFSALPLMATTNVSEDEVRAYYEQNPARFPKPAADAKAASNPDPAADYAAVRAQVETTLKLERARRAATKAASDLSYDLFEAKMTPGSAPFEEFLKSRGVTVKSMAPFTREAGPAEFGGSPEIAAEAFKLGEDRKLSDAVSSPTGAVILFWKDLQAPRTPLLGEVREKVAADYTEGEKRKRFVELGRTLRTTLESRLKAGDTFEKAVAAAASANGLKIDAKMIPAFTRRQPPQDIDYSIFGALPRLNKGSVSDMIVTKDQGLIVYAADKVSPDLNETSPQYAAARAQIAMASARIGVSSYLNEVITAELKKSEPAAVK